MSYQVEKSAAAVTIHFSDGTARSGVVFLAAASRARVGPETVLDLLRDREPWLPFKDDQHGFSVVRKSMVAYVRHRSFDPTEAVLPHAMGVAFIFVDNSRLQGTIHRTATGANDRLLDVMNDVEGFVDLVQGDERFAVNTALVREALPG